jgi:hypothetical protein
VRRFYLESSRGTGYSRFMRRIDDIVNGPKRKEIETRLKIIQFFDDYGAKATKQGIVKGQILPVRFSLYFRDAWVSF